MRRQEYVIKQWIDVSEFLLSVEFLAKVVVAKQAKVLPFWLDHVGLRARSCSRKGSRGLGLNSIRA
jgi:hypothetical protein